METLVAVNAPPRKHAVVQERPRRCPTPAPSKNGQITPESATTNAVTLASRMRSMSVSMPAMNIKHVAADLREKQKRPGRLAAVE